MQMVNNSNKQKTTQLFLFNTLFSMIMFFSVSYVLLGGITTFVYADVSANAKYNKTNDYRIGVGDILEVITWKEPDFSRNDVLVRLDGKISFPLLDDIIAAGQTTFQLKKKIESLLKQYIESPNVTVIIRSPVSQKFYVIGEVTRIGEYPLGKELTIIQAFAMAGGFTEWATKKEILLIRKENGKKDKVIKIDYKKFVQGKELDKNILIKADDTIIVP